MSASIRNPASRGVRSLLLMASILAFVAGCGKKNEVANKTDNGSVAVPPPAPANTPGTQEPSTQRIPNTESNVPQPPPAPRVETRTIAAGTAVAAALQGPVSSTKSAVGDRVVLKTVEPIRSGGAVVVPAGATVYGQVTHVVPAGRVKGGAAVTLRFNELVAPDGKSYRITAEPFRAVTKGSGKQSGAMIGGGAAAGGVLGGVLGGKGGVLPGAAIGGILGTTAAVATKGKQIELPAGQQLTVRITEPVGVRVAAR